MAIEKIKYKNKVAIKNDESLPEINKVTDENMNEIKKVINNNADELIALQEQGIGELQEINENQDKQIEELENEIDSVMAPQNLIDLNNITENTVINGSGEIVESNNYYLTNNIEVKNGDVITFKATNKNKYDNIYGIACFNSNNKFIARYVFDDGEVHSLTISASTTYIRVIIGNNAKEPMLVKADYLPEYGEFNVQKILKEAIPNSIKEQITNNENNINLITNAVTNINEEISKELQIALNEAGNYIEKFRIIAEKNYIIKNISKGTTSISMYTRLEENDITNLETITANLNAGEKIEFCATENANYVRGYMNGAGSVEIIEEKTIKKSIEDINKEIGKPFSKKNITGTQMFEYNIVAQKVYLLKNTSESSRLNCFTRATINGENVETVALNLSAGEYVVFTATEDALYLRFVFNEEGSFEFYEIDKILGRIENIENELEQSESNKNRPSLVEFNLDYNMRDLEGEMANIDYTTSGKNTILEQIYDLFDNLVTNYSDYVSKVDAVELTDLTYPDYANGISNSATYLDTPSYKTYMYKFICSNEFVGNGETGKNAKKKILLIGGLHGNEIAAPFNLYLFAKQLCNGILNDENFFKLRSAFDIYIIPCLNGYGMYHLTRGNANNVNINRNYPIANWAENGEDTKNSATGCNYTGASAGSEFETQLVMAITELIEPNLAIDCHNYSSSSKWQFYTALNTEHGLKLAYQSLVDCSFAFKKKFPNYFGTGFSLLQDGSASAPGSLANSDTGTTTRWWFENEVDFATTIEISDCINYENGIYSSTAIDKFGANTFSVAEYTLRNLLLRYAQYVLDK